MQSLVKVFTHLEHFQFVTLQLPVAALGNFYRGDETEPEKYLGRERLKRKQYIYINICVHIYSYIFYLFYGFIYRVLRFVFIFTSQHNCSCRILAKLRHLHNIDLLALLLPPASFPLSSPYRNICFSPKSIYFFPIFCVF